MRRSTARRLATVAVLAVCPAAAPAGITSFFMPVTIPQSAIDNDSRLANMQCWDVGVTTDGDWTMAGMELTLPSTASFYNHSFGGNTRPSPNLIAAAPALAFDTYISGPGDSGDPDDPNNNPPGLLGGFPTGNSQSFSGNRLSATWFNLTSDVPGTYQIARITFPRTVFPVFHPSSSTSQTSPDSTTPLNPHGPFFASWVTDADGSWHDGANWSTGSPPLGNWIVTIDVGGAAVRTITYSQGNTGLHIIDSQEHIRVTGGTISTVTQLHAANGLTLDGGTVRHTVSGSAVQVGPAGGRLEDARLRAGLLHPTTATLVVRNGLVLEGSSTLSAGAPLRFEGSPALRGTGTVHHAGGVIDVPAGSTLTIGESLLIRKTPGQALRINGSFALAGTATIDLTDGALVNDYTGTSPLADIRAKIISGYNGGSWNGTGVNSSSAAADPDLALGYAEASALFTTFPATFVGESIDNTTLLIRLTRNGDADLDGTVNLGDFNRLAANFGSTGALWDDGDFNYDGAVNLLDFNLLAANFGQSAAGSAVTPGEWANLAAAVPEPAAACGMIFAMSAMRLRGRRMG